MMEMTPDEARAFLRNDDAPFREWCIAAQVLCESADTSFEDWLLCLKRRGLPAETGACKLYQVSHRPRKDSTVWSFVLD